MCGGRLSRRHGLAVEPRIDRSARENRRVAHDVDPLVTIDSTTDRDSAGPRADAPTGDLAFVILEHHAHRLHWDFRLERDGVLVSWALPKGMPPDSATNHLAVRTEDHPLEMGPVRRPNPRGRLRGRHGFDLGSRHVFDAEVEAGRGRRRSARQPRARPLFAVSG